MDFSFLIAVLVLILAGSFAGFCAGLFGIGGGVIIVPALYYALAEIGISDELRMHIALGTSVATILVTSLRSLQKHHEKRAVDWKILKLWAPFIGMGAFFGAQIAGLLPGRLLTLFFSLFMIFFSVNFMSESPKPRFGNKMPTGIALVFIGNLIGILSSILGIGGGVLGVSLMVGYGRDIHRAVATASGFGFAIGLVGMFGYVLSGLYVSDLPMWSLGYINLPAFFLIIAMTYFCTPFGVYCAHNLPGLLLKKLFSIGLLCVGLSLFLESILTFLK